MRERTKVSVHLHAPPNPWTSTDICSRFQGNAKRPQVAGLAASGHWGTAALQAWLFPSDSLFEVTRV